MVKTMKPAMTAAQPKVRRLDRIVGVMLSLGRKAGCAATPAARQKTRRTKSIGREALNAFSEGRTTEAGAVSGKLKLNVCGPETVTRLREVSRDFSCSSWLP